MFLVVSICSGLFGVIFIDEVFLRKSSHDGWISPLLEGKGVQHDCSGGRTFCHLVPIFPKLFSSRKDKQSKERP